MSPFLGNPGNEHEGAQDKEPILAHDACEVHHCWDLHEGCQQNSERRNCSSYVIIGLANEFSTLVNGGCTDGVGIGLVKHGLVLAVENRKKM